MIWKNTLVVSDSNHLNWILSITDVKLPTHLTNFFYLPSYYCFVSHHFCDRTARDWSDFRQTWTLALSAPGINTELFDWAVTQWSYEHILHFFNNKPHVHPINFFSDYFCINFVCWYHYPTILCTFVILLS